MASAMSRVASILALLVLRGPVLAADQPLSKSWWDGDPWTLEDRGFNWYPPDAPLRPSQSASPSVAKPLPPKSIYEMRTGEDVGKELKRLRDVAIFNPTESNIYAYFKAQLWMFNNASRFADATKRVMWKNPDIDLSVTRTNVSGALISERQRKEIGSTQLIKQLASNYGLVFFLRSDCPYCHDQADVLTLYRQTYGMDVLPITMDGHPISQFPDARPDNGISMALSSGKGIPTVPALYLVHKRTNSAVQIGYGILSMAELVDRIRILTTVPDPVAHESTTLAQRRMP
jgi:conjugal transfer pilus assembly protein TraF